MADWKMTQETAAEIDRIIAAEDAGENPFNLIHISDEVRKQAVAQAADYTAEKELVAAIKADKKATGSKKEQAIAVYASLEDKSRKSIIAALVGIGFKQATASTYQAQLKNWV